jgi:hypothetical protein
MKKGIEQVVTSIEFFLDPKILSKGELTGQINDHLANGNLVVIRKLGTKAQGCRASGNPGRCTRIQFRNPNGVADEPTPSG